jgi:hypothetical protein
MEEMENEQENSPVQFFWRMIFRRWTGVEVKGRLWERAEREEGEESVDPEEVGAGGGEGTVVLERGSLTRERRATMANFPLARTMNCGITR